MIDTGLTVGFMVAVEDIEADAAVTAAPGLPTVDRTDDVVDLPVRGIVVREVVAEAVDTDVNARVNRSVLPRRYLTA